MVWLRTIPDKRFASVSIWSIAPLCVACIGLGAFLEATAFRLAKFDEVDFCNQSLGAVLAAGTSLILVTDQKPPVQRMDEGTIAGIVILIVGGMYAFA